MIPLFLAAAICLPQPTGLNPTLARDEAALSGLYAEQSRYASLGNLFAMRENQERIEALTLKLDREDGAPSPRRTFSEADLARIERETFNDGQGREGIILWPKDWDDIKAILRKERK